MPKKNNNNNNRLSYASILVTQGKYTFHIVSMPSSIFKESCFTVSRTDDPINGFQRNLDETRADEISEYINNELGSIPTAIILSAQPEADFKRNIPNKTISFQRHPNAFLIIDGQHRVWGYKKSNKDIRVPVIIYEGLTRVEEAQLFIDINENQKKVPDELILDVKRLLEKETEDERICGELFAMFLSNSSSSLNQYINLGENKRGNLSRIVFYNSVSPLIKNTLHKYDTKTKFEIINNYLNAFNYTFNCISDSLNGCIGKTVIFQALMNISDFIINLTYSSSKKLDFKSFCDTLNPIISNMSENTVKKPGKSYKAFSEKIKEATIKKSLPMNIIT